MITDTVLSWAEEAVADLSGASFIIIAFLLFIPLSFLIPSSSGLATVAMPIMAPLASFSDVAGEVARAGSPLCGRPRDRRGDRLGFRSCARRGGGCSRSSASHTKGVASP